MVQFSYDFQVWIHIIIQSIRKFYCGMQFFFSVCYTWTMEWSPQIMYCSSSLYLLHIFLYPQTNFAGMLSCQSIQPEDVHEGKL